MTNNFTSPNLTSPSDYLSDLVQFALDRILVHHPPSVTVTLDDLHDEFLQNFGALYSSNSHAIVDEIHQVRICIEILRGYVRGKLNVPEDQLTPLAHEYSKQSYRALLINLGTSYEELQGLRGADVSLRESLATRLGVDAGHLDGLLLDLDTIQESDLHAVFGFENASAPPLDQPEPFSLLVWRREYIRNLWAEQDTRIWGTGDEPASVPIVDPDRIYEAEVPKDKEPPSGNSAYGLYIDRQNIIKALLTTLDSLYQTGNAYERLASLVADPDYGIAKPGVPVTIDDLCNLAQQRDQGDDVQPKLHDLQLSLQALLYLRQLAKLTDPNGNTKVLHLSSAEWSSVYSILVQVQKLRMYSDWRAKERDLGITLGPDYFQISNVSAQAKNLPEWRSDLKDRRTWSDILEARTAQYASIDESLAAAIDATEEVALPLYRDGLVGFIANILKGTLVDDAADVLSERLLIDVRAGSKLKISRRNQGIATLQSLLFSLRTGSFPGRAPAQLNDNSGAYQWELTLSPSIAPAKMTTKPRFPMSFSRSDVKNDATVGDPTYFNSWWRWLGSYDTWSAAMVSFIYPENLLIPALRENQTPQFQAFVAHYLQTQIETPEQARGAADYYFHNPDGKIKSVYKYLSDKSAWPSQFPADDGKLVMITDYDDLTSDAFTWRAALQTILMGQHDQNNWPPGLRNEVVMYMWEIFFFVPMHIALQLQQANRFDTALSWLRTIYDFSHPLTMPDSNHPSWNPIEFKKLFYGLVQEDTNGQRQIREPSTWLDEYNLNPHTIGSAAKDTYTFYTVSTLIQCLSAFADSEFASDRTESLDHARVLYLTASGLLGALNDVARYPKADPNPLVQSLQDHLQLNLFKLHSGLNIAGIERPILRAGSYTLALDYHPTPYRYSVLIDRAKQLTTISQQIETQFLGAVEKQDAEAYNLLKAKQDLSIADAGVQLQNLRVVEANDGIQLANLQQDRATIQQDTYQGFIAAGQNQWEQSQIKNLRAANEARKWVTGIDAAITVIQAHQSAFSVNPVQIIAGTAAAAAIEPLAISRAAETIKASNAETQAQIDSLNASYERRREEWQLQANLANEDIQIGRQQVKTATDHAAITLAESVIAQRQADNARDIANLLANKFTNADLYQWMSGVLGNIYSYFLRQATSVARLAQDQLAFERQEVPLSVIQSDYWRETTATNDSSAPDRRGLTGSARLLQDIYKLDQYAFETNRRKLQLSKTFSVSRLVPLEFQQMLETGVLNFETPMELFDRDFPGHYLRLIRRVRVSVIALIPPVHGIKATLSTTGVSRVTINNDRFDTVVMRRGPEIAALTSPSNATGVFELDIQPDMLLPFEGSGVDTFWEFQLPRAANSFNFRTIADVLMTVEYTALNSYDYRRRVIQRLGRNMRADQSFSLRSRFADQWYYLHNSSQNGTATSSGLSITFPTDIVDFPPNVDQLKMESLLLYIARAEGQNFELNVMLSFKERESGHTTGGNAKTVGGVISTRNGNGSPWTEVVTTTQTVVGDWTLAFTADDGQDAGQYFQNEAVEDIFLVLSYKGQTPEWP